MGKGKGELEEAIREYKTKKLDKFDNPTWNAVVSIVYSTPSLVEDPEIVKQIVGLTTTKYFIQILNSLPEKSQKTILYYQDPTDESFTVGNIAKKHKCDVVLNWLKNNNFLSSVTEDAPSTQSKEIVPLKTVLRPEKIELVGEAEEPEINFEEVD